MAALQNGPTAHHQRIHTTNSSETNGDDSELKSEGGQQLPSALINSLLQQQPGDGQPRQMGRLQQDNGNGGGQLDFSMVHSQLANYAGHFPEEMSSLFGSVTGVSSQQQTTSSLDASFAYPQQPSQNSLLKSAVIADGNHQPTSATSSSAGGAGSGRRHRSSDLLKCSFCPKKLPGQAALQTHLEDCRQLRVHECPQCGKRFKARGGLQQHNRIHINDRPYQCHYCPKQFTQKSHVDQHERIHTGAKPFACQYCGRQFRQRSQQMGHESTHVNRERIAAAAALAAGNSADTSSSMSGVGLSRTLASLAGSEPRMNGSIGGSSGAHRNSLSSEQSSPMSEMAGPGGMANGGQQHFQAVQQQHQRHLLAQSQSMGCHSSGNASLAIAAAAAQQQMAFDGLLRAVGTGGGGAAGLEGGNGGFRQADGNSSSAVDSLLAMSAKQQQQQQQAGMELNEQLRLIS